MTAERNVVLLVLDSVRKDFFDRFAPRLRDRADVNIDGARAPSSWSVPSHASMFTGELPHQHGVHTYSRAFDLEPDRLFHTRLPHSTIGVSANTFAGSAYGFDQYFDEFVDVTTSRRFPRGLSPTDVSESTVPGGRYARFVFEAARHDHPIESLRNGLEAVLQTQWHRIPGPKLVDDSGRAVLRTARTLAESTTDPWFMFVNLMDAHSPLQHFRGLDRDLHSADSRWSSDEYDVWELFEGNHPDYWATRESVYAAYVDYLDRLVTEFVEHVEQATTRETTVVVTADHGENHGESAADGLANHKSSLAEPLLHVPLAVLNAPDGATAPDGLVSLLDLPDLLTGLAHGDWVDIERDVVPAELIGMSAGPAPPEGLDEQYYRRAIRVCYRGDVKYEWDSLGNAVEYELDRSRPSWQRPVKEGVAIPKWANDEFSVSLAEALSAAKANESTDDLTPEIESQLEHLGYR